MIQPGRSFKKGSARLILPVTPAKISGNRSNLESRDFLTKLHLQTPLPEPSGHLKTGVT